jgi:hypothetical protein
MAVGGSIVLIKLRLINCFFIFFEITNSFCMFFLNNYFFKIKMNTRPAANAKEPKKKLEKNIISF